MVPPIVDHDAYNTSLRASLADKLFFLPILPRTVRSWVDFGCADGSLLKAIAEARPGCRYGGVDSDPAQREAAAKEFPLGSYWPAVTPGDIPPSWDVLIFSSVLHEAVKGGSLTEVDRVFGWLQPDYVVVRDMAIDEATRKRPPNLEHLISVFGSAWHRDLLQEFHKRWDTTESEAQLAHFLLKSPWRTNWKRELEEDYLALSPAGLLDWLSKRKGYRLIHFEHYTPQAIRDRIRTDFGFEFTTRTHVKMVLERAR